MRSGTERMKSELDRLRHDFDVLVSNYEPSVDSYQQQIQIHSQIDTFRQFYEQEFRQRQALMSKLTPTTSRSDKSVPKKPHYYQSTPHLNHEYNPSNERHPDRNYFKQAQYETNLADQRTQTLKAMPSVPRQASSLLTINTTNNGTTSSTEFLRDRHYV